MASFPRKQDCRASSVIYQKTEEEQSKHHEHTETHEPFCLTDGADSEVAIPNKVKLAAVPVMTGLQSSQAYAEQAAKQNSHSDLRIVPISCLQVKKLHRKISVILLTRSYFIKICL